MDLRQLDRALAVFAALDPAALPIHWPQILVAVAILGEPTYGEIEELLNLTNSSVSRSVNAMGDQHRLGHKGMGLLQTVQDPDNRRRYRIRLTSKGRALMRQLHQI